MAKLSESKILLNKYLADHYADAFKAKEEGKLVCWSTAIAPQELMETFEITTVFPENHAAAIGARKQSMDFLEYAEGQGFPIDVCSYARINFAYADLQESSAANIPQPDLLFACANTCQLVIKWYENLSRKLNIPLILLDTPFSNDDEVSPHAVTYVKKQFMRGIEQLEQITKKKFDPDRLSQVMRNNIYTVQEWKKVCATSMAVPSPMDGFELFNYMAAIVFMRCRREAGDLYKMWREELEEKARQGLGPWEDREEKFRVMWDGIICWPYLASMLKVLKKYDMNMVVSPYTKLWTLEYEEDDLDGLAKAYTGITSNINMMNNVQQSVDLANQYSLDGVMYHSNRSCKLMSMKQFEVMRKVGEMTGKPVTIFDGDQSDPRAFSLAQFETRVQALCEIMDGNKQGGK